MKKITYLSTLIFLFLIMLSGCGESTDPEPQVPVNPNATDLNEFFSGLPDWQVPVVTQDVPVPQTPLSIAESNVPYRCGVEKRHLVREFKEIMSVETNFGQIYPGALIQGKSLATGELKPITLARAPITINTNLPINETFREIEVPNSVNVQQVISEMQIASASMPEGSQAGAGLMNFDIEEASTFEQSMLAMGISGGFTEPQSQVGLNAEANVSTERSRKEHTIVAKFIQEMFTVRLADDLIKTPSDFFANEVTLQNVSSSSQIGSDNLPLYIESVTYGRILIFTMKSTEVSSADQLSAALNASFQNYVEAGGSLTAEQEEILSNSKTTIFSAGGTKEAANAAIAGLNWSEFFREAPATTAVPISFVAKTVSDKSIASIQDEARYDIRNECTAPESYDVKVIVERVAGNCASCKYISQVETESFLPVLMEAGDILFGNTIIEGGTSNYSENFKANEKLTVVSVMTSSGLLPLDSKEESFSFPFNSFLNDKKFVHELKSPTGLGVIFRYKIIKTAKYPSGS